MKFRRTSEPGSGRPPSGAELFKHPEVEHPEGFLDFDPRRDVDPADVDTLADWVVGQALEDKVQLYVHWARVLLSVYQDRRDRLGIDDKEIQKAVRGELRGEKNTDGKSLLRQARDMMDFKYFSAHALVLYPEFRSQTIVDQAGIFESRKKSLASSVVNKDIEEYIVNAFSDLSVYPTRVGEMELDNEDWFRWAKEEIKRGSRAWDPFMYCENLSVILLVYADRRKEILATIDDGVWFDLQEKMERVKKEFLEVAQESDPNETRVIDIRINYLSMIWGLSIICAQDARIDESGQVVITSKKQALDHKETPPLPELPVG